MAAIIDNQCGFTINDTRGWNDVTSAKDRTSGVRFVLESPTRARISCGVGPAAGVGSPELDRVIDDYLRQTGGSLISKGSVEVAGIPELTFTYQIRTKIAKRYVIVRKGHLGIPGIDDMCCEISILAYPYEHGQPLSFSEEQDADAIVKSITFQDKYQQLVASKFANDRKVDVSSNPQQSPVTPPTVQHSAKNPDDAGTAHSNEASATLDNLAQAIRLVESGDLRAAIDCLKLVPASSTLSRCALFDRAVLLARLGYCRDSIVILEGLGSNEADVQQALAECRAAATQTKGRTACQDIPLQCLVAKDWILAEAQKSKKQASQSLNTKVEVVCQRCGYAGHREEFQEREVEEFHEGAYEWATCSLCNGRGRTGTRGLFGNEEGCARCGGSGKMKCELHGAAIRKTMIKVCPMCGGRARLTSGRAT